MLRGSFLIKFTLCIMILFAAPKGAFAVLGEPVQIPKSKSAHSLSIQKNTQQASLYSIHETQLDSVNVREYVNQQGVVFGVAWNGYLHPDLTLILGSYATAYQKAEKKTQRVPGRRHHQVQATSVTVEKWGHMRDLKGRAYDPALLPQGVSANEIE